MNESQSSCNSSFSSSSKRKRVDYEDEWQQTWWTWIPSAMSLQYKKTNEALLSPVYSDQNNELQWRMVLFPRGNKPENHDYFSLFLELLTETRDFDVRASFAFYLRSSNGKSFSHKMSNECRFSADKLSYGFPKYLRRSDMLDGFNGVLCHVRAKKIYRDQSTSNENNNTDEDERMGESVDSSQSNQDYVFINESSRLQDLRLKVATDLEAAVDNGAFSDVMLVAGGKIFRAHRIVLAMRSPVFASMLESNEESIELKDISELVVKDMLRFVYTGSVSAVTGKLMIAARTYGLEDLYLMCQERLARNICVQNAGNILIVADQAKANKLKQEAMRFISQHAREVIETAAYKRMVHSHLHLIEELYRFEHSIFNQEEDSEFS